MYDQMSLTEFTTVKKKDYAKFLMMTENNAFKSDGCEQKPQYVQYRPNYL